MTSPELSLEEVARIAHLARLELTESELRSYQQQLSAVLGHVAMLEEVDTAGVEPTFHAVSRRNVMRDDVVAPCLPREEALFNAAQTEQSQFLIQTILDE